MLDPEGKDQWDSSCPWKAHSLHYYGMLQGPNYESIENSQLYSFQFIEIISFKHLPLDSSEKALSFLPTVGLKYSKGSQRFV